MKQIIDIVADTSKSKKAYPIVDSVCEYIKQHLTEDISTSQLSETFNVSIYYLSHVFKAVTGTTITEYKNELRLTKAKLLLKDSDLNISEIASEVGFENSSYFTEVFSKSETISPQKFRRLHKKA